ncbi:MAG: DUF420 domain-containing protein [Candidatus Zixiibacteriota bacterium]
MTVGDLPLINACLNGISSVLLVAGFLAIKRGLHKLHKRLMLSAVVSSALFLTGYLVYHEAVGSVPYPYHDWTRPLYYAVLIPHVILAATMVPFILAMLWFALRGAFDRHSRLARFVWPVWMFVSVSGVTIYLMLYEL